MGWILLMLLTATTASSQLLSPGDLAEPHAEWEGLSNCTRCHVLGEQVQPARCLDCHEALAARIEAQAGYHKDKVDDCIDCHSDHRGRDYEMIRWDRDAFDHDETGYRLDGKHAEATCRQCHRSETTYLGLPTDCAGCHQDEHRGQLGSDCSACHTTAGWEQVAFDHDRARFRLVGKHSEVDCGKCHAREEITAFDPPAEEDAPWIADGNETPGFVRYREIPFAACADCHADEHDGQFVRDSSPDACSTCHSEEGWTPARFDHDSARFALNGAHVKVECLGCHPREPVAGRESGRQRFRPIDFARCDDCHTDRHAGQFPQRDCAACHTDVAWKPSRVNHDETRYPLRGRHDALPCEKCHTQQELAPGVTGARYRPLPIDDCAPCHADPHAGQFADRTCASCHIVDGWKTTRDSFDHDRARFPLRGRHVAVACEKCHAVDGPDQPPRWRPVAFDRCDDCHSDYHEAQFVERDCADCHLDADWKPATPFDHDSARYRLDGAHLKVGCHDCHGTYETASGETRRRYRPLAMECAACHS